MNRKFATLLGVAILIMTAMVAMLPQSGTIEETPVQGEKAIGGTGIYVIPMVNRGYAAVVKDLIDSAQSYIHISMMEISSTKEPLKTILDALIAANNRGVQVEIVYEGDLSTTTSAAITYLENGGIPAANIHQDGSTTTFLHTKMIVIDGKIVILGAFNWSIAAFDSNNEYGIAIFNTTIATFFDNYFQSIWTNANLTPSIALQSVSDGNYIINTTYDGWTYNTLLSMMQTATTRLHVALYDMAYFQTPTTTGETRVNNLVNEIVTKNATVPDVKVLVDDHSTSGYSYLVSKNVSAELDSSSYLTHLKLVIADDWVYIGDANWNASYLDNDTHTVGVVIHNATLADYFDDYFLKLYQYRTPPYYIPGIMPLDTHITVYAGSYTTANIAIINAGYKNGTYFNINIYRPSYWRADMARHPDWYRANDYDWRVYKLYVQADEYANPGNYTVGVKISNSYYDISYTAYITVQVIAGTGTTPPVAMHPIITEVYYNDANKYANYRFVEIYNPTSSPVDLDGWKLINASTGTGYTIHGLTVNAYSSVTIAMRADFFVQAFGKYPDIGDGDNKTGDGNYPSLEIYNKTGGLLLENSTGGVVDAVYWEGYNNNGVYWNITAPAYTSIVRVPYWWDNDTPGQWVNEQKPWPYVQNTPDKVVMIDRAHYNSYSSNIDHLTIELRKMGLYPENITSRAPAYQQYLSLNKLQHGKLLILMNPALPYNTNDTNNITSFVNNYNGSLLLTCRSNYNYYGKPENLNPILSAVSSVIRFNNDSVSDATNNSGASYSPVIHHFNDTTGQVTVGVSQVVFYSPDSLVDSSYTRLNESDGAILFATGDNDTANTAIASNPQSFNYPNGTYIPVAAGQIIGTHRVAALGATVFSDYDIYDYDNLAFTKNLILWLMGIKAPVMGTPDYQFASTALTNYSMWVTISATNVNSVEISYSTDNWATSTTGYMADDGLHNDGAAGDGIYGYLIPNVTAGTKVSIKITGTGSGGTATANDFYFAGWSISYARNQTSYGNKSIICGQVTVVPGTFYNAFYIQDGSGAGIKVYGSVVSSLTLNYGDYVKVFGTVTSYRNDAEISITSASDVVFVKSGTPVTPYVMDLATANTTNYGRLISVTGYVKYIDPNGKFFTLRDSANSVNYTVYLANSSISISSLSVGDYVQVVGVQAQYYSTYELYPRTQTDITVNPVPEFGDALIPILALLTMLGAFAIRRRR